MSAAEGCPFTARLLKTFVDASAFHLLQDAILGGELFTRVVSSANVSGSHAPPRVRVHAQWTASLASFGVLLSSLLQCLLLKYSEAAIPGRL